MICLKSDFIIMMMLIIIIIVVVVVNMYRYYLTNLYCQLSPFIIN